jgi:hypothetical protein
MLVFFGELGATVGFGDGWLESAFFFGEDESQLLLLLQFRDFGLLFSEKLLCPVLDGDVSSSLLL